MLLSLHIENIAVVKSVDIDFSRGFNALTGETGAGKSIIIDSINLILGAKSEKELIRHGEESLLVSALFGNLGNESLTVLEESGITTDNEGMLLIQRTVSIDGRSQVKINGRSVSLSVLKGVSSHLVCIHGQNDTGALLDPISHLSSVDVFAGNDTLLLEYRKKYEALENIRKRISEITLQEGERERRREMLEYQIKDIDEVGLHPGEEEELVDKRLKIRNSEKILKNSEFVYKALKGSEKGSALLLIDKSAALLDQLSDIIPSYEELSSILRDVSYKILDVAEEARAVIDDIDSPRDTLDFIEDRLDKLNKLKRKYGLTVEDILAYRDKAKSELDTIVNYDDTLYRLKKEEHSAYVDAMSVADELNKRRTSAKSKLEECVKGTLEFLDMPKVEFFAEMTKEDKNGAMTLYPWGYDKIEFYISANKGALPQSISKIASGGELARIMLALKSALVSKEGTPTLIFDEIDSGVSGKTARKIGIKMMHLSEDSQIICVTHSAQIASLADKHYLISKSDKTGVTETSVVLLDKEGRVRELSRILGGINVTDSQRKAAEDMLNIREV